MTPDVRVSYTIRTIAITGSATPEMVAQFKAHDAFAEYQHISDELCYVDMFDFYDDPEGLLEFVRRVVSERSEDELCSE